MKGFEYVPYKQCNENKKKAVITRIEADFSSFSEQEIQLLGYLSAAADCMNQIYLKQVSRDTETIINVIMKISDAADREEKEILSNYLKILFIQNGPWAHQPRKNHLLDIPRERIRSLARQTGVENDLIIVEKYFFDDLPLPDRVEFYPENLTEEELEALGDPGKLVNTAVVRGDDGTASAEVNEKRFREECTRAAAYLKKAKEYTENPGFQIYLDAKIEELSFGTPESRRLADYHWIRHNSPIDIVISSALEEYLDNWKNFKGAAAACVTAVNTKAEELLNSILSLVPDMEKNAPWKVRRTEIDPESLPKLKFVDVLNWSGDYITSPMTVLAQSLPNDEWVGKNIGTVNMVYMNTSKVLFKTGRDLFPKEFFTQSVFEKYNDLFFQGLTIHGTLHEIGHTTGRQDEDHAGEPSAYFESDYSWIEETRAELFGMWAADFLADKKVLSRETADACQYSMLTALIRGLQFKPEQAHTNARNIIYHYFLVKGALLKSEEKGRTVFSLDLGKTRTLVKELLGEIGNIKSSGDRKKALALKKKYCYTDEMQEEIKERMRKFPQGTGLIFPELEKSGSGYTRTIRYPEFIKQKKFQHFQ